MTEECLVKTLLDSRVRLIAGASAWRVDFAAGPPPGWDAGEWVPENGSLRAVPTIEGRRNYAVSSNNAWSDGDHSLVRIFDDSVVRVTLRRQKPGTLDVVLSLRESNGPFERDVRPFLKTYCVKCHNADKEEGGVRLDVIGPIDAEGRFGNTWPEIQRRVIDAQMPPKDAPQPPEGDKIRFLDWVAGEIQRAQQTHGKTGGKVVLRRLNRSEYRETLRELLDLHPGIDTAANFPDDDTFHGFENIGSALNISPAQMRAYVENAARVLKMAFPAGKQPATEKTRMMAIDATKHAQASDDFNWRVRSEDGGELRAVADIGTHWLDLVQFITGQQIVEVCADLRTIHAQRQQPIGGVGMFPTDAVQVVRSQLGDSAGLIGAIALAQTLVG